MPTWEIVLLVILGITLFIIACYAGVVGFFLEVLCAIFGGSSGGGGSSSGGSGFGGGSSGGGGSSSNW